MLYIAKMLFRKIVPIILTPEMKKECIPLQKF